MTAARHLSLVPSRPRVRADCLAGGFNAMRPCRYDSCHYHVSSLRSDGVPPGGASCTLDIADNGGATHQEVGDVMGVSRARVQQIEIGATRERRVRRALLAYRDHVSNARSSELAEAAVAPRSDVVAVPAKRSSERLGDIAMVRRLRFRDRAVSDADCARRAFELYVEGPPCFAAKACLLRAGHAHACVLPYDLVRAAKAKAAE